MYILELPSQTRTITGVSTSITGFIGNAVKGPVNDPITVHSFPEYERVFGGLWKKSNMGYAVYQYFQNGGKVAVIVRVHNGATVSSVNTGSFTIKAADPGDWSANYEMEITVEDDEADIKELSDAEKAIPPLNVNTLFNLSVKERINAKETITVETFRNLSTKPESPRFVDRVLKEESNIVRSEKENVADPPVQPAADTYSFMNGTVGVLGDVLISENIVGGAGGAKTGIYALDNIDLINILCIPPYNFPSEDPTTPDALYTGVYPQALDYCEKRRAILLVDPPFSWNDVGDAKNNIDGVNFRPLRNKNAALFFPHVIAADPKDDNRIKKFVACGAVAGLMARIDSERGVWKSPAGIETTLNGILDLTVALTNDENGDLNPLGINCLRVMPPAGIVVWGSRTLRGADRLADQWKYLAVRRTALFIEESLYRGTQWVVFEPNDEPLWSQIRLNVGAFMHNLFRQGAFQGTSPKEAYFVKCDKETTTQYDIDRGIVNIVVGFAPLKPAEFVILQIQQITRSESV